MSVKALHTAARRYFQDILDAKGRAWKTTMAVRLATGQFDDQEDDDDLRRYVAD